MSANFPVPPALRIMTYSQDGLGLGHMRRTSLIAAQLLQLCPDATVLTLSDSQLGQFFHNSPQHDYIKLPSIVKLGPGHWRAASLALAFDQVHELRQQLIREALLTFQPHLLLVDHMPHGAMGELLPALAMLKHTGAATSVVLGLRDILDAPAVIQERWRAEGAYQAISDYYDRVLVYGMPEVFDLAEQYCFPPEITSRLRYCGYVCDPEKPRSAKTLRRRLLAGADPAAQLIVATAGGGADAYPMMRSLLDALPIVVARQRCRLLLVAGPFMPPDQRADLKKRAQGLPVTLYAAYEDNRSLLAAADVVVGMAGYNTSVEMLQAGKPTIMIPRRGPSAEQRMRTRLFAEKGWVEVVDPDELSADHLASVLLDCLVRDPQPPGGQAPDLNGLQATALHLLQLLTQRAAKSSVHLPLNV